jgi:catechol 2,3-dioxygenase-like lactoylglutathione lyase family enzyme
MATVSVRYFVHDVDAAIDFYCQRLGFEEVMHPAPAFAMLSRGDLRLNLACPAGDRAAGRRCQMGRCPSQAGGTGSRSRWMTSTAS